MQKITSSTNIITFLLHRIVVMVVYCLDTSLVLLRSMQRALCFFALQCAVEVSSSLHFQRNLQRRGSSFLFLFSPQKGPEEGYVL